MASSVQIHSPMDERLTRACTEVVCELMKHKAAKLFLEPVDWKAEDLPDYLEHVKEPMDLGTVQKRLASSHYDRLESFANDVRRVWKAAFVFNAGSPLSPPFKQAKIMFEAFEKKFEELERSCLVGERLIDTMDACHLLSADLLCNPLAEFFLEPVVASKEYGTEDYTRVISEPKDLLSIHRKLSRGHYSSPDEFARDVRLVWQNAITYNSLGMYIGQIAAMLGLIFDRRLAQLVRLGSPTVRLHLPPPRQGYPEAAQRRKLFSACQSLKLEQLDALATLVSTKCRAAFSQLGEHEVAVDVDELDMACWTQLMQLVRDPDRIPATEGPSRAVVRLKMVEPTRKHLWDTTEKKEKGERDALAEHVRYVAKPLTGAHEAKHSDPGRPYLRDGVSSRETDWPAQFARAWGTRKSKLDPLGLVSSLVTASLDYQHRGTAETAHVMLLAVAYDVAHGVYRLWDHDPEPPAEGARDHAGARKAYYDVAPAKLGRFPAALVGGIYKGQLILARWRHSSRLYRAEVIGGGEAPNLGHLRVRYREPDAGTAAQSGEQASEASEWAVRHREWAVRHRGEGRPDCDVVYTIPAEDVTLSPKDDPSEARRCAVDPAEMKRRKKQDKGRLKQEAQEREARLGTAEPAAASPFDPLKWEPAHCAHHWLCQCEATVAAEKKAKSAPSPPARAAAPSPPARAAAPSPPARAAANAVPPRDGDATSPPKATERETEREKAGAAKAAPPTVAAEELPPKIEVPPNRQAPSPTPPPQVPNRATPSPTPPLQPPAKRPSPSPPPSQEPRKAAPSPEQPSAPPSAKKLALSPPQSRPLSSLGTAAPSPTPSPSPAPLPLPAPAPSPSPAPAPAPALVSPAKPSPAAASHPRGATDADANADAANADAAGTGLVPASAPASRAASPSTSMVLALPPPRATFPAAPPSAAVDRARSPDAPPSKVGRVRQLASAFGTVAPPAEPPDPGRLEQQTQHWRRLLGLPTDSPPPAVSPPTALLALPPPRDGGGANGKPAFASFALPRKRAAAAEAFAPHAEAFPAVPAKRPALVKAHTALRAAAPAAAPRSIAAPPRCKLGASVRAGAQGAAPRDNAASREARIARLKALHQATPRVPAVPKVAAPLSHSIRKRGRE